MIDRATTRQIVEAVQREGGEHSDVEDLVKRWEGMQDRLHEAGMLLNDGDVQKADAIGAELEREFGRPLSAIVSEHLRRTRSSAVRAADARTRERQEHRP